MSTHCEKYPNQPNPLILSDLQHFPGFTTLINWTINMAYQAASHILTWFRLNVLPDRYSAGEFSMPTHYQSQTNFKQFKYRDLLRGIGTNVFKTIDSQNNSCLQPCACRWQRNENYSYRNIFISILVTTTVMVITSSKATMLPFSKNVISTQCG